MDMKSKVEIYEEKDGKRIALICDVDWPLRMIHDFASSVKAYVLNKMNEEEKKESCCNKECGN